MHSSRLGTLKLLLAPPVAVFFDEATASGEFGLGVTVR